jgi:tyrosine-specific transport protein
MSKIPLSKQLGCIMIVTGTEIGAGILALPIISAQLGFLMTTVIMLIAWLVMTYTSLLIADICLKMPEGTSFSSMAKRVLGLPGAIVAWLSFVILLYAISIAYISAASSAFNHIISSIPEHAWSLIFVCVFAAFVVMGVKAVDWANRLLLTIKLVFLVIVCVFLLGIINPSNLLVEPVSLGVLVVALPVIVTSFTSHVIVPTLTDYLHKDAKVIFRVLIIGSLIPLFLYFLWLAAVLGVLPLTGPISFMSTVFDHKPIDSANVGDILAALQSKIHMPFINISVNIFTDISVMTSYLSVSLALYHFNVDSYKLHRLSLQFRTLIATLLTFIIPLLIAQINPDLFIPALSYVGACIAVLLIIMPALMAHKLTRQGHEFSYKLSKFKPFWVIAILLGLAIIAIKFSQF